MKKYYYPAQFTRKGIALLQSSEVLGFFQCVFKPPYKGNSLWAWNMSYHFSVSAFFRAAHLLYISERNCQCVRHSCKMVSGHHCLPQVMGLHKLDSCYSLRAASSHISHQCTQKTSQQGCQMVWLGNNTPFVRKQCVLRRLWSVPRYDV